MPKSVSESEEVEAEAEGEQMTSSENVEESEDGQFVAEVEKP